MQQFILGVAQLMSPLSQLAELTDQQVELVTLLQLLQDQVIKALSELLHSPCLAIMLVRNDRFRPLLQLLPEICRINSTLSMVLSDRMFKSHEYWQSLRMWPLQSLCAVPSAIDISNVSQGGDRDRFMDHLMLLLSDSKRQICASARESEDLPSILSAANTSPLVALFAKEHSSDAELSSHPSLLQPFSHSHSLCCVPETTRFLSVGCWKILDQTLCLAIKKQFCSLLSSLVQHFLKLFVYGDIVQCIEDYLVSDLEFIHFAGQSALSHAIAANINSKTPLQRATIELAVETQVSQAKNELSSIQNNFRGPGAASLIDPLIGQGVQWCSDSFDGSHVVQVSSTHSHVLAVTAHGSLFCWGNVLNQTIESPKRIVLSPQAKVDSEFTPHFSILDSESDSDDNDETTGPHSRHAIHWRHKIVRASAGEGHSLILTETGLVFSFGSNSHGQLGTGCAADSASDVPLERPALVVLPNPALLIAAGGKHSLVLCLPNDPSSPHRLLYGWGDNNRLQVTFDSKLDSTAILAPVRCLLPDLPSSLVDVQAGFEFSVALTSSGRVYIWGGASAAKVLGHSDENSRSLKPITPAALQSICIVQVVVSGETAAALSSNGKVYSWGDVNPNLTEIPARANENAGPAHGCEAVVGFGEEVTLIGCGPRAIFAVNAVGQVMAWSSKSPSDDCRYRIGCEFASLSPMMLPVVHQANLSLPVQIVANLHQTYIVAACPSSRVALPAEPHPVPLCRAPISFLPQTTIPTSSMLHSLVTQPFLVPNAFFSKLLPQNRVKLSPESMGIVLGSSFWNLDESYATNTKDRISYKQHALKDWLGGPSAAIFSNDDSTGYKGKTYNGIAPSINPNVPLDFSCGGTLIMRLRPLKLCWQLRVALRWSSTELCVVLLNCEPSLREKFETARKESDLFIMPHHEKAKLTMVSFSQFPRGWLSAQSACENTCIDDIVYKSLPNTMVFDSEQERLKTISISLVISGCGLKCFIDGIFVCSLKLKPVLGKLLSISSFIESLEATLVDIAIFQGRELSHSEIVQWRRPNGDANLFKSCISAMTSAKLAVSRAPNPYPNSEFTPSACFGTSSWLCPVVQSPFPLSLVPLPSDPAQTPRSPLLSAFFKTFEDTSRYDPVTTYQVTMDICVSALPPVGTVLPLFSPNLSLWFSRKLTISDDEAIITNENSLPQNGESSKGELSYVDIPPAELDTSGIVGQFNSNRTEQLLRKKEMNQGVATPTEVSTALSRNFVPRTTWRLLPPLDPASSEFPANRCLLGISSTGDLVLLDSKNNQHDTIRSHQSFRITKGKSHRVTLLVDPLGVRVYLDGNLVCYRLTDADPIDRFCPKKHKLYKITSEIVAKLETPIWVCDGPNCVHLGKSKLIKTFSDRWRCEQNCNYDWCSVCVGLASPWALFVPMPFTADSQCGPCVFFYPSSAALTPQLEEISVSSASDANFDSRTQLENVKLALTPTLHVSSVVLLDNWQQSLPSSVGFSLATPLVWVVNTTALRLRFLQRAIVKAFLSATPVLPLAGPLSQLQLIIAQCRLVADEVPQYSFKTCSYSSNPFDSSFLARSHSNHPLRQNSAIMSAALTSIAVYLLLLPGGLYSQSGIPSEDHNASQKRFVAGEHVMLAGPPWRDGQTGGEGTLQIGDVGVVLEDDGSERPYNVRSPSGDTYWYKEGDLVRASSNNNSRLPLNSLLAPELMRMASSNQESATTFEQSSEMQIRQAVMLACPIVSVDNQSPASTSQNTATQAERTRRGLNLAVWSGPADALPKPYVIGYIPHGTQFTALTMSVRVAARPLLTNEGPNIDKAEYKYRCWQLSAVESTEAQLASLNLGWINIPVDEITDQEYEENWGQNEMTLQIESLVDSLFGFRSELPPVLQQAQSQPYMMKVNELSPDLGGENAFQLNAPQWPVISDTVEEEEEFPGSRFMAVKLMRCLLRSVGMPAVFHSESDSLRVAGEPVKFVDEEARVVRNERDWVWSDQDGGSGSLGTVYKEIDEEEGWCAVRWDNGNDDHRYRIGLNGKYDLLYASIYSADRSRKLGAACNPLTSDASSVAVLAATIAHPTTVFIGPNSIHLTEKAASVAEIASPASSVVSLSPPPPPPRLDMEDSYPEISDPAETVTLMDSYTPRAIESPFAPRRFETNIAFPSSSLRAIPIPFCRLPSISSRPVTPILGSPEFQQNSSLGPSSSVSAVVGSPVLSSSVSSTPPPPPGSPPTSSSLATPATPASPPSLDSTKPSPLILSGSSHDIAATMQLDSVAAIPSHVQVLPSVRQNFPEFLVQQTCMF